MDEAVLRRVAAAAAAAAGGAGRVDASLLDDYLPALAEAARAGRALPRPVLQRCRATGQRAAAGGVALPALVELHLSAGWRLWRELEPADAATTRAAADVLLRAADDAAAALAAGYQRARRELARAAVSARREFVDDLLTAGGEVASLLERAPAFGLDLTAPHAVAVVRSGRRVADDAAVLGTVERAVRGANDAPDALVTTKGGRIVAVFAAADEGAVGRLAAALGAPSGTGVRLARQADVGSWQIGVGRPYRGPDGVRASYDEAVEALERASQLDLRQSVILAADLLVYRVLLRDRAAISDLVDTVLAPLATARGGAAPLLQTLDTFLATGGNATETARRMHLSVRAVTYRLGRIRQLTGSDPADPAQRFTLQAAALGARLLGWAG